MTTNTIEKMVLVRLYGKLGKLFGREHRLSVSSVREARRYSGTVRIRTGGIA